MDDVIIIIILILLNGIFSMSEIALISARKARLASDAKHGSKGAEAALRLAENPDTFLSTIQIGITLIGILTGLYSGAALAADVGRMLQHLGLEARTAQTVGQIAIVAVVTFLSIVVGELVPKRIGLAAANTVARLIARPMKVLSIVAMPAVWLLSVSTALIVRLFGMKGKENTVTEDEIKALIRDGADAGQVRKVEQDIMERALVLGDLRVASIMTPKIDVEAMRLDMSGAEVKQALSTALHNNYPVFCDKAHGKVCGIVSLKQLVLAIHSASFVLADVVSRPVYFPESMSVYDALDRMKKADMHFALVCDEFGAMTGVITPADILDALVGLLPKQDPGIVKDGDNSWTVDAALLFYDFLSYFGFEDLYTPASYSTVGGFILEELRRMPESGDTVVWNGLSFTVVALDGARIRTVALRMLSPGHDL